jgi:hypothetical protein
VWERDVDTYFPRSRIGAYDPHVNLGFGGELAMTSAYVAVSSNDGSFVVVYEDDFGADTNRFSPRALLTGAVAGSGYGFALDILGDKVAVGAPLDYGTAYLFRLAD